LADQVSKLGRPPEEWAAALCSGSGGDPSPRPGTGPRSIYRRCGHHQATRGHGDGFAVLKWGIRQEVLFYAGVARTLRRHFQDGGLQVRWRWPEEGPSLSVMGSNREAQAETGSAP